MPSNINRLFGIWGRDVGEGVVGGVGGGTVSFFARCDFGNPLGAMHEVGDSGAVVLDEAVLGRLLKTESVPVLLV